MSDILVLNNAADAGPALLAAPLEERGYTLHVVDPSNGVPSVRNFAGIFIMGGPSSVNNLEDPKILPTLRAAEEALNEEVAALGICLGHQALTLAGGGSVGPCRPKEMGIFDQNGPGGKRYTIELTAEGRTSAVLQNVPRKFPVVHIHDEQVVKLGPGMKVVGRGGNGIGEKSPQMIQQSKTSISSQAHLEVPKSSLLALSKKVPGLDRELDRRAMAVFDSTYDIHEAVARNLVTGWLDNMVEIRWG